MSVAELLREDQKTDEYWVEMAKLDFVVKLNGALRQNGMSRSDFARIIGRSPAYITKIMQGDANLTIESMVKLARAVGLHFQLELVEPPDSGTRVLEPTRLIYHTAQERMVCNYGR